MVRNKLNKSKKTQAKNVLRTQPQQANSSNPSFTLWISFLVSMISLELSGIPIIGLLSTWPLGLAQSVSAQNLPELIDFNLTLTMTQGLMLQGGTANDMAGVSVASAGDVNGDGIGDLLVGALQASTLGRVQAGTAYLIYGGPSLPSTLDLGSLTATQGVALKGGAALNAAGYSVASAGDVNGDGKGDFLVGAPFATLAGRTNTGAVYLIYGGVSLPATIDLGNLSTSLGVVLQGGATGDNAGISLSRAGDVNGDGKEDFLVGAYAASQPGRTQAGAVYLIYGSASLPSTLNLGSLSSAQGVILQGGAMGDLAGSSVSSAGDVNGDGKSDFLVGAIQASPVGRTQAGAAYLIYGSTNLPAIINLGNLTSTLGVVLQGTAAHDGTGNSVSSAGDVNDDGLSDFLVGADLASPAGKTLAGAAYLIYGSSNLPSILDLGSLSASQGVVLQGGAGGDETSISLSSAGDVNGDGKGDFLIGADKASPLGRIQAGEAYLIYGGASLPSSLSLGSLSIGRLGSGQGVILQGGAAGDNAGITVSNAGDVNGDGGLDILIGASGASPLGRTQAGAVYVVFGLRPTRPPVTIPMTTLVNMSSVTPQTLLPTPMIMTPAIMTTTSSTSTTPLTVASTGSSTLAVSDSTTTTPHPTDLSIPPIQSTVPTATSPASNLIPIIASAVGGGLGLAACLAAGIGLYAYRKKSRAKQLGNASLNEFGVVLQDKNNQSGDYAQINLKKNDQSDNVIPPGASTYQKAPAKKEITYGETSLADRMEEPQVNPYDSVTSALK